LGIKWVKNESPDKSYFVFFEINNDPSTHSRFCTQQEEKEQERLEATRKGGSGQSQEKSDIPMHSF
jgi:hypothetical protein